MNSVDIAKFVSNFNGVAVGIAAIFAICWAFLFIGKKLLGLDMLRGAVMFRALCFASLVAFALEATVFNASSYLRFFSGPELQTTYMSDDKPNMIETTDGTLAEISVRKEGAATSSGITFTNIDRVITSVHVEIEYDGCETAHMTLRRADREGRRAFFKKLYKHFPREDYTPLYTVGKVSELMVLFRAPEGVISIVRVSVNKPIPFYFSGVRLIVASLLIFALIALVSKRHRAIASRGLFDYRFDPSNLRQNLAYAFTVALLLFFTWTCIYTSASNKDLESPVPSQLQYNKYLVDAIIAGRTWLDAGNPEKLLAVGDSIYDVTWRVDTTNAAAYVRDVDWMWDWVFYEGKFYCYYGVVPALILYVPYTLVTGNYLSYQFGSFLFNAITILLLALLWRYCVKKYMPDCRFAFYIIGFLTLFFASGYFFIIRQANFFVIAQSAGYMFTFAGILFLLKSIENESAHRLKLLAACLCFALAVGCRPNLLFVSLLIPLFLWKQRSWKLAALILAPYIVVAIPMCVYNYVRFGSIFEFGTTYVLTGHRNDVMMALNPIGRAIRAFITGMFYLFQINKYSFTFPFVECFPRHRPIIEPYILMYNHAGGGIINFPVIFCLFYLLKNIKNKLMPKSFAVPVGFLSIAVVLMGFLVFLTNGFQGRYMFDFMTFITFASLFSAYYYSVCGKSELPYKIRMKAIYVVCAASVFVGLFLCVTGGLNEFGYNDPVLYRYLELSLGLVRL